MNARKVVVVMAALIVSLLPLLAQETATVICPVRPGTVIKRHVTEATQVKIFHHRECCYAPNLETPLRVLADVKVAIGAVAYKGDRAGLTVNFAEPPLFRTTRGNDFPLVRMNIPWGGAPAHFAQVRLTVVQYPLRLDGRGQWQIDSERQPRREAVCQTERLSSLDSRDWIIQPAVPAQPFLLGPGTGLAVEFVDLRLLCPTATEPKVSFDCDFNIERPSRDARTLVFVPEITTNPRP